MKLMRLKEGHISFVKLIAILRLLTPLLKIIRKRKGMLMAAEKRGFCLNSSGFLSEK
jgi:hypothetical protein